MQKPKSDVLEFYMFSYYVCVCVCFRKTPNMNLKISWFGKPSSSFLPSLASLRNGKPLITQALIFSTQLNCPFTPPTSITWHPTLTAAPAKP